MWSALIDYWYYTGDTTYNNITLDGMMWQVGPGNAFIVSALARKQCFSSS